MNGNVTRRSLTLALALAAGVLSFAAETIAQPRAANPHGPIELDCALCHGEADPDASGQDVKFDHSMTGFPLEGRHRQAHCRDCHEDPRFAFVGTGCADCHIDVHAGELGADCEQCHSPQSEWIDRDRQREAHDQTSFPLVGAHSRVDCELCHLQEAQEQFVGTPTDCWHCHHEAYAATTDPDHEAAGMGTDCSECHSPLAATWGRGDFVHPASFPLTGGHAGIACATCHTDGFGAPATDCYSCHRDDYESANDPDHAAFGFPTDCTTCHRPSDLSWDRGRFEHPASFPLTGGHSGVSCAECHVSSATPSADCYACHQADYDGTNDPNHRSAGFPTDCAACHSTRSWSPSTWDHDTLFPIYSGKHDGEWNSCADCHLNSADYGSFECIYCHEHGRTETDGHHDEVDDYVYQSTACYQCHPDGRE